MEQNQNYEGWLDNIYKAALQIASGTFIDVGANLGQTISKVLSINANQDYLGFEPQILCCAQITQAIMHHNLENCRILPIGLSNKNAILELLTRTGSSSVASMIQGFRPDNFYDKKQLIYVAIGDEILKDLQLTAISCIKIDVEGGELEVMEGLKETLHKHAPALVFEVLNHYLVVTQEELDDSIKHYRDTRTRQMEDLIRSCDYKIFHIIPNGTIREIDEIRPIVSNDLRITNYIAIHKELTEQFISTHKNLLDK